MADTDRHRRELRTIRVSLDAALRHTSPHDVERTIDRARQLLAGLRERVTDPDLVAEIAAFEQQLHDRSRSRHNGHGGVMGA